MALIKCSECGKEVSDKAQSCPNCGCPIAASSPNGTVRIKLSPVKAPSGFNGNQKASISANWKTLWEGQTGDVAELYFKGATSVVIKYHLSMMHLQTMIIMTLICYLAPHLIFG